MNPRISFSFIITLILAAAALAQQDSFPNGGLMRSFIVYAPSGISNPPLVINMHGMGSNASQQRLYTQFDKIADREKFIVVYPNGVSNSWDVIANRDVTFILALVDTIDAQYKIDRTRVYATGMSMGGYMSHRLGCAAAGTIAAIASVSGLNASYNCPSARPMPVLQIHGTADSIVRYIGVAPTINNWVSINGCPQTPQLTSPYPASNLNSKVRKDYYGPCTGNSEVILLTVEGGGHSWPGGLGQTSDINASEEIWAFFKNHALPSAVKYSRLTVNNSKSGISACWSAGKIRIYGVRDIRSLAVLDAQGKTIAMLNADAGFRAEKSFDVPIANVAKGVYLVIVEGINSTESMRIVIQ
jgi:poly(3-hydroxybutyrate) depolymerase